MPPKLFPPLPPELATFAESGLSMHIGTRDGQLRPAVTRAVGLRVWPGGSQLTLYLAEATSRACVANLRENGKLAVTFSRPATHETVQIKGSVREVREATPEERPFVEDYRERFAQNLAPAGLPPRLTRRLRCWPAFAVDLEIEAVFAQTPGPGAGARMSGP